MSLDGSLHTISDSLSTRSDPMENMDAPEGSSGNKKGLSFGLTSFFLVAQMAGAGFLSLPKALANTGWLGIPMMTLFCLSVSFTATRLGRCWIILEERWPEDYKKTVRQPYMEIAARSLGQNGRRAALVSVILNLYGSTTVFIILISQMIYSMEPEPAALSTCELVLIVGSCIIPLTWLGTPKDFWQASLLAVVSTVVAVLVIVVELIVDQPNLPPDPWYPNPTVTSFSLGFGAILFAFGGSAVFPTIQNDMSDRSQFWKSVIIGFAGILSLYVPVAVAGYVVLGYDVDSNILLSVPDGILPKIAIVLEIVNLLSTFVISFNPVAQSLEDIFNVPNRFGIKRCLLRSILVVIQMIICLSIPSFDLILNLIGGSMITFNTFVFPPLMYIRLIDMKGNPKWPKRTIPTWQRVLLTEIIIVGVIGGICSTISAIYAILTNSFTESCFTDFY